MKVDYSKDKPVVYVMVCADISPRQIVVQSCHASLEAGIHMNNCKEFPSSVIMLKASNEKKLLKAARKIEASGIKCKLFYEPPMKRYTAFATEVIPYSKRIVLKKYRLLSIPGASWWYKFKKVIKL